MYDQMGNYIPVDDATAGSPYGQLPPKAPQYAFQNPQLQAFLQSHSAGGLTGAPPMPPPRPQGLGQGPVAGQPIPMPPPRPMDLGQSQQPVGPQIATMGGYRPEGPEATSPTPSQGGPGAGSSNFAAQHPQLPFLQRLMNPQGSATDKQLDALGLQRKQGLIQRMATALGPQGLFGSRGLGGLFGGAPDQQGS